MAEYRVGIDVDLGIERKELARLGHDEGIHFDEARVLLHVELVQRGGDRLELRDLRALQPEAEGDLRAPGRAAGPPPGVWLTLRIFSGVFSATSSMSMPPAAEAIKRDAALLAIERQGEIDLPLDLRARLHVDPLHGQPLGAGLFGLEARAEHGVGGAADGLVVAGQLDAAGLAATAGVHLGLDDPHRPTERVGGSDGFVGARGHATGGHRNAVIPEYLFGLIFVQIHSVILGFDST